MPPASQSPSRARACLAPPHPQSKALLCSVAPTAPQCPARPFWMEEGENDLDREGRGPCLGAFGPGFLSGRTSITLISAPLPRLPRDPRNPVCAETRKAEGPRGAWCIPGSSCLCDLQVLKPPDLTLRWGRHTPPSGPRGGLPRGAPGRLSKHLAQVGPTQPRGQDGYPTILHMAMAKALEQTKRFYKRRALEDLHCLLSRSTIIQTIRYRQEN